jgi:hypothetical protein
MRLSSPPLNLLSFRTQCSTSTTPSATANSTPTIPSIMPLSTGSYTQGENLPGNQQSESAAPSSKLATNATTGNTSQRGGWRAVTTHSSSYLLCRVVVVGGGGQNDEHTNTCYTPFANPGRSSMARTYALTFINNVYQKEIDVLEKIRMEAEEKLLRLVKKKEHAMTWHKHKVSLVNQYRQEQSRLDFDTIKSY